MSEISGPVKAIEILREVTADLFRCVERIEHRVAEISGIPVNATDETLYQKSERKLRRVADELSRPGELDTHARDEAGPLARPSTELVLRVNQALERLGAQGGYVDQLRRLETKMDKQAEDIQTFETIITELATAVSHTLKTQSEVATKRDLLDTRGMLMVALDNLKQSLVFRNETVDAVPPKNSNQVRWVVAGISAAAVTVAFIYALVS